MNRTDKNFKHLTLSQEETDAFLDELFSNLFDNDAINSETDAIPNLSRFDRRAA